jgi:hypothetical protein
MDFKIKIGIKDDKIYINDHIYDIKDLPFIEEYKDIIVEIGKTIINKGIDIKQEFIQDFNKEDFKSDIKKFLFDKLENYKNKEKEKESEEKLDLKNKTPFLIDMTFNGKIVILSREMAIIYPGISSEISEFNKNNNDNPFKNKIKKENKNDSDSVTDFFKKWTDKFKEEQESKPKEKKHHEACCCPNCMKMKGKELKDSIITISPPKNNWIVFCKDTDDFCYISKTWNILYIHD